MPTWMAQPIGSQQSLPQEAQNAPAALTTWSQGPSAGHMQGSSFDMTRPDPSIPSVADFMAHERSINPTLEAAGPTPSAHVDGDGTAAVCCAHVRLLCVHKPKLAANVLTTYSMYVTHFSLHTAQPPLYVRFPSRAALSNRKVTTFSTPLTHCKS